MSRTKWFSTEEMLEHNRRRIDALRNGDGIREKDRPPADVLKQNLYVLENRLGYAEKLYSELRNDDPEIEMKLDMLSLLMQSITERVYLTYYHNYIVRNEALVIPARNNPRRSRWGELHDWMHNKLSESPKLTARELWNKLPSDDDGQMHMHPFYLDGDMLCHEAGHEMKFRTFETDHVPKIKKLIQG